MERIGGYLVERKLGEGGMGTVFLARTRGGRAVALKVAKAELTADPVFRERFRSEVEAARAVGGFHTASVVDADVDGDPLWLATAYIPGPTLAARLAAQGAMDEAQLRALAAALAEALESIHSCGLVHRDLKPGNIVMADDGPRVLDFGIARAVESTRLTATGTAFGTPGFLAPEQALGHDVGGAADVFALGAVLVAAAGGSAWGEGTPMGLMYRSVHEPPDTSAVPAGLVDVVTACLAKDPAARPAPAELLDLLTGEPAAPARPDAPSHPPTLATAPPAPTPPPHLPAAPATPPHPAASSAPPATPSHLAASSAAPATPSHLAVSSAAPATPSHLPASSVPPATPSHLAAQATPPHLAASPGAPATPSHLPASSAAPATPSPQGALSAAASAPPHPAASPDAPGTPPHLPASPGAPATPPHLAAYATPPHLAVTSPVPGTPPYLPPAPPVPPQAGYGFGPPLPYGAPEVVLGDGDARVVVNAAGVVLELGGVAADFEWAEIAVVRRTPGTRGNRLTVTVQLWDGDVYDCELNARRSARLTEWIARLDPVLGRYLPHR
ncbi:protein kinase domain-containing protein [Streptomyces collinus]|uniref:serine/threonine-protein kinase n=1 Tax=Streptomyces collinus TaxID=42684 RepID=UPI003AF3272E|nr:Serine/threonine-protein kinase PknD [Streptomyces collinus]UJA17136.1 Serine/threonine-protein kinase PknD [Streptomyces collinus]